jgi:hypothetical protein
MRFATIALAASTALGAGYADAAKPNEAASYAAAAPAASVDDEYELIAATRCVCGGEYVPYDNFVDYQRGVIYELVATRCASCREDRFFYFDLTPRFGTLSEFREAKLATRAAVPEGELPCPSPESAITADSITEEYIILETTPHSCGTPFTSEDQGLLEEGGHQYDVLSARCPADGAEAAFYFNVDSLMFHPEKYPELKHWSHQLEPPEPLPGRTLETAFAGNADERRELLEKATHRADGGALNVVSTWTYRGRAGDYDVVKTTCEKCGAPVRLYFLAAD